MSFRVSVRVGVTVGVRVGVRDGVRVRLQWLAMAAMLASSQALLLRHSRHAAGLLW
jgi:hypothetical protein